MLSARDLAKSYGPQTLFQGATLTIGDGERVGLLGPNGMGKSTLLRVLAGIEPPDEGVIDRKRGATSLYLPQEPKLPASATPRQIVEEGLGQWHAACARHAEVTAAVAGGATHEALLAEQAQLAENIERLGGWSAGHRASDMLHRLGVLDADRAIGSMSGGEQRRVALAKILVAQPDLAILDEPTNHLDVETIEFLEQYLAERFAGAVLLVTHDRYVLEAVADRILELEHGVLTEYSGNYSDYLEQKATLLAHAERGEQNRLNRLRRERAWLLRGAKARSTKQKARIKRAQELIAVEPPKTTARAELSGLQAGASQSGKTILELIDVRMEIAQRTLIAGLTLYMVQGDRIGVVGPNGVGKTTLLKLVAGELQPVRGRVVLGARTKIAHFDQARAGLRDDWSVFDNVAEREGAQRDGGGQVQIGELTLELRSYLERFLFDGSKQRQRVSALSGGERARVALAKALRGGANLLLLDEPTNDLDLATLAELEELLASWPGCSIVVSHDRSFLNRVVTSVLAFEPDGAVVRYAGNYDDYRALRTQGLAREAPATEAVRATATTGSGSRAETTVATGPKPLSYSERLELAAIVDEIAAAEELLVGLSAALSDPATYAGAADGGDSAHDPSARKQLQADYERARIQVARLTTRWEALEARSALRR
jgi:ATP-binding cassette subfamily F protein uup